MSSLKNGLKTTEEMREIAARICRDYLTGAWKNISAEEIKFRRISGGLSNFLYYVSLPDYYDNNNSPVPSSPTDVAASKRVRKDSFQNSLEPKEVLLRIYGQSHGETALETMLTESVVFTLLSERNLGPKLHGIFPGGRIEQYIPARSLQTNELSTHKISMKIAEKMAEIHSLSIPVSKEPEWLWKTMGRWLKNIEAVLETVLNDTSNKSMDKINIICKTDFNKEVSWIKSIIDSANYPVLFCHNDLQEGNILLKEDHLLRQNSIDNLSGKFEDSAAIKQNDKRNDGINGNKRKRTLRLEDDSLPKGLSEDCDPDLIIIDYEYCAYNYRGFDLANHFVEWTLDYSNDKFPFFYHKRDQYPTKEQQNAFVIQYLKKFSGNDNYMPSTEELEDFAEEISCFRMVSHLFWTLWAIINVHQEIEFGYWEYGLSRLQDYYAAKELYISKYEKSECT